MPGDKPPLGESLVLFSVLQEITFPQQAQLSNLCSDTLSISRKPRLIAVSSQNRPKCPPELLKVFVLQAQHFGWKTPMDYTWYPLFSL